MELIKIETLQRYRSIQKGFVWEDVPAFSVITGVNGAGKTHLLDLLRFPGDSEVVGDVSDARFRATSQNGENVELAIPTVVHAKKRINDLIAYHKKLPQLLAERKKKEEECLNWEKMLKQSEGKQRQVVGKIDLARIDIEIKQWKTFIKNNKNWIKQDSNPIFERELEYIAEILKKDILDLTDKEIRAYANPCLNSLTEIQEFEDFLVMEKEVRDGRYIELCEAGKYAEIPRIRNEERSFQKINRLFEKYGFKNCRMVDPYPMDGSRSGKLEFETLSGENIGYSDLSSGEQMIVKLIVWTMGKDFRGRRINTMLLDEPDAHLHPTMCKMMVEILEEISREQSNGGSGIRIIITTHSPSTAAFAPDGSLFVLDKDKENNRHIKQTTAQEVVSILSNGIFTYEKAMAQFTMAAKSVANNLVFVEGKTDVAHFSRANKILDYDLDVEFIDLHDADALEYFIKATPSKFFDGKKLIALFDCDQKGTQVLSKISGKNISSYAKNLTAEQCEGKSFAMKIVAPSAELNNYCPVEFLYPLDYLKNSEILDKIGLPEFLSRIHTKETTVLTEYTNKYEVGDTLLAFGVIDSMKQKFAEKIGGESDPAVFENFRQTLDLIGEIIRSGDSDKSSSETF